MKGVWDFFVYFVSWGVSRETEPIGYRQRYTYQGRFIIEIGSRGYEGWEVLLSSICELETLESWWYKSVWRPENWGADASLSLIPKTQEPGLLMPEVKKRWMSQLKQREWICPSAFSLYLTLNRLDDAHMHWESNLIYLVYWYKWSSLPEALSQMQLEILFNQ